jgi:hypothetical protein
MKKTPEQIVDEEFGKVILTAKQYNQHIYHIERLKKALTQIANYREPPELEEYPAGQVDDIINIAKEALRDKGKGFEDEKV